MKPQYHYGTITEALEKLKKQGFTIDFNLKENYLVSVEGKFNPDDFEIMDVYRYEGDSDPGDETVVYALVSKSGLRGVLVAGYGTASDNNSVEALKKLQIKTK